MLKPSVYAHDTALGQVDCLCINLPEVLGVQELNFKYINWLLRLKVGKKSQWTLIAALNDIEFFALDVQPYGKILEFHPTQIGLHPEVDHSKPIILMRSHHPHYQGFPSRDHDGLQPDVLLPGKHRQGTVGKGEDVEDDMDNSSLAQDFPDKVGIYRGLDAVPVFISPMKSAYIYVAHPFPEAMYFHAFPERDPSKQ